MGLRKGKKIINEPPLEPLGEEMSPSRRKKKEAIKKVKDFPYCRETRESASPTRLSKSFGINFILCLCWQFGAGCGQHSSQSPALLCQGLQLTPTQTFCPQFILGNKPGVCTRVSVGKRMLRDGWWGSVTALPGENENISDDSTQITVKTTSRKAQHAQDTGQLPDAPTDACPVWMGVQTPLTGLALTHLTFSTDGASTTRCQRECQ